MPASPSLDSDRLTIGELARRAQIGELLALHSRPEADMGTVRDIAVQRLAEIDAKMADLQRMKAGLQALVTACPGHGAARGCPILAALSGGSPETSDA